MHDEQIPESGIAAHHVVQRRSPTSEDDMPFREAIVA
jgi:hypothetical protein